MTDTLRPIAVYVEEPEDGAFSWSLAELQSPEWTKLERSKARYLTYREAMAEGLLRLQALTEDLDRGPRTTGEMAPGNKQREPAGDGEPASPPGFFGFGPVE